MFHHCVCVCVCVCVKGDVTVLDDVRVHDDMTLTVDSNLNGTSSTKFTLTCFSTCGPATNVTWTRDSVTVTEGTETVLDDPVTAQYTHTLTVTGRLAGLYTCTAANQKPSVASATLMVQGLFVLRGARECSNLTKYSCSSTCQCDGGPGRPH